MEDDPGDAALSNHAHSFVGLPCDDDDDSGGKSLVAPLPEPVARFSDAALATSRCLGPTTEGAAITTFATEKIRRIRANVLS